MRKAALFALLIASGCLSNSIQELKDRPGAKYYMKSDVPFNIAVDRISKSMMVCLDEPSITPFKVDRNVDEKMELATLSVRESGSFKYYTHVEIKRADSGIELTVYDFVKPLFGNRFSPYQRWLSGDPACP
ncbi:hypothetical protein [Azospirillum sp. B4]|uniref:hypothetical protein n=1 Tax=Azospirillum sp. B4 TaxID=95605 RepID=UPI0011DD6AA7|nr:hypothetical protein [Azospirillum sp. B4]